MIENQFSEEYHLFFKYNPLPMWVYDIGSLKFLDVNEAAIHYYGYSRNEFLRMTIKEIRPEEDLPFLFEKLKNMPPKIERSSATRYRKKDCTVIDVEVTSHEIEFNGKKARFVLAVDITEAKKSLHNLQKAEEKFRTLVEQSLIGIYIIQDGRFTYVNPRFAEIFGYTEAEIVGTKTVSDLVAPNYRHKVNENIRKRLSGEIQSIHYRFRGIKKDGTLINVEVHGSKSEMNDKPSILGTIVDITDKMTSEKEIRHRQNLEKLIADVSSRFINIEIEEIDESINESLSMVAKYFRVDRSYVFLYDPYNKKFRNSYIWPAYSEEQITGRPDFISVENFPWGLERIVNFENVNISNTSELPIDAEMEKNLLTSMGVKSLLAVPLVHKNNLEGILGFNTSHEEKKWSDEDIRLLKLLGDIFISAIDRKCSQELLYASEKKYRSLVETTGTGFVILDAQGRVEDANDEYLRLTGRKSINEIIGRCVTEWTAEYDLVRNAGEVRKCFEIGFIKNLQIDYVNQQGIITPIEINATVVQTSTGKKIHTLCRDITQRRRTENALLESQQKYQTLIESVNTGIFMSTLDGKFLHVNSYVVDMSGYTSIEELMELPASCLYCHSEDRERIVDELLSTGSVKNIEMLSRKKNGTQYWISMSAVLMKDINGKPTAVLGSVTDITERKIVEEKLVQSEVRFRSLVHNSSDIISVHDENGLIKYITPSVKKILGYQPNELIGKNPLILVHSEDLEFVSEALQLAIENRNTGIPTEFRIKHSDGSWRYFEAVALTLLDNPAIEGIILTSRDITGRRTIEKTLSESEEKYRNVVERANDGIIIIQDGLIKYANPSIEKMWGGKTGEIIGTSFVNYIHPDHISEMSEIYRRRMAGESIIRKYDTILKSKEGRDIPVEIDAGIMNYAGKLSDLVIIHDITERKLAESLLIKREKHYRTLFDLSPVSISLQDHDGNIVDVNNAFCEIFKYSRDEVIGKNIRIIVPPEYHHEVEKHMSEIFSGKTLIHEVKNFDKNGNYICTELRETTIQLSEKEIGILTVGTDITERKYMEDALIESEKRLKTMFDNAEDGILIADIESKKFCNCNPMICRMLGYSEEEILAMGVMDIHPEEELPYVINQFARQASKEINLAKNIPMKRKNGTIYYADVNSFPIMLSGKECLVGFFRDNTERKQMEETLRDSEKRLTALLDASTQPIMLMDTSGRVLAANTALAERLSVPLSELMGNNAYQFLPYELAINRKEKIDEVIRTGIAVRFEDSRSDIFFDNSIFPILDEHGNVSAVAIFSNDMTEYKRAQKLLIESESQIRQIIDLVPHYIFAKNRNGEFILANQAMANAYGASVKELIGKKDIDLHPNNAEVEQYLRDNSEVIDKGTMKDIPEEAFTDFQGNTHYLHTIKIPFTQAGSVDDAVLGVCTDITARKNIEQALRESEEEYRTLAEAAHDIIFIIDLEGYIKYVNKFAASQFNISPEEMIGKKMNEYFPIDVANRQQASLQKAFNTAEPIYNENKVAFPTHELWLGTWLVPLKSKSGKINSILGVSRDITAKKLAEEELEQSNELLKQQILELEISKQAVSNLLEEVTATRDENLILFNDVKKRQHHLENLSREIINIEEQERKRFSQELHDSLGQVLTTLKINLDMAISSSGTQQLDVDKYLHECRTLTEDAMYEVKQLSYALRPSVLDDFGLKAALRMLVTQTEKRINIPIELDLNIDDSRYDSTVETVIYRIVQESVTNIAKHSKATNACVQLVRRDNILALSIIDNGIGLTKGSSEQDNELHLGLRNIRERVEFLGGKLYIDSKAGKGTEIIVEINISQ